MTNEDNIKKWLNNELSEEERREFEQTKEFESLQKLSSRLLAFKASEYDVERELEKLRNNVSSKKESKIVKIIWSKSLYRVAAAIALVVVTYFLFFYHTSTKIQTLAGEKTKLYLPDSSLVILNAETKLTFAAKNWSKNRTVTLDGEAFFKVAKGSRFEVLTQSGIVAVLGTQFNVKDRKEYYEVVCYEGLVRVESNGKQAELKQNDIFRLLEGIIREDVTLTGSSPSWINQESSFVSVPFSYVIDEFESQFDISIITNNVDTEKLFTGSFGHEDMDLALQAIARPLNLKYHITEKGNISLTGESN
jgi:ferric-dicitrate binding protein FerR (iron transport regulator)